MAAVSRVGVVDGVRQFASEAREGAADGPQARVFATRFGLCGWVAHRPRSVGSAQLGVWGAAGTVGGAGVPCSVLCLWSSRCGVRFSFAR